MDRLDYRMLAETKAEALLELVADGLAAPGDAGSGAVYTNPKLSLPAETLYHELTVDDWLVRQCDRYGLPTDPGSVIEAIHRLKEKVRNMTEEINPESIYYIKLGSGGGMEQTCFDESVVYVGFGSERDEIWELAQLGRWAEMHQAYVKEHLERDASERTARKNATAAVNIIRYLFENDGSNLWTTFANNYFYWGFLENTPPFRNNRLGDGIYRKISGGWKWHDLAGNDLIKTSFPGGLQKKARL